MPVARRAFILSFAIGSSLAVAQAFSWPKRQAAHDQQTAAPVGKTVPTPLPSPTPPEPQETISGSTEEVRIPVVAFDEYGGFDPTLTVDDIMVLEDGVPQQIQSIRRMPASILLLVSTSGDANPAMRTKLTAEIALNLIAHLNPAHQISVIQYTNRTELLQDWTNDRAQLERALRTRIHSGRGSRLAPAIAQAAAALQTQPFGARHLVIVGDGVA